MADMANMADMVDMAIMAKMADMTTMADIDHMADIANLTIECKCQYKSTYSANKNTLYELLQLTSFAPSHCGLNIEVDDTHYAHTGVLQFGCEVFLFFCLDFHQRLND